MRILLADDERDLTDAISAILRHSGYDTDAVYDGGDALRRGQSGNYDCIILDIMMPKMDGVQVLKNLRARGITAPVILLTAKSELEDRLIGLDSGADDYITKPFETAELLARIRAVLRRRSGEKPDTLTFCDMVLNRSAFELSCGGKTVPLGGKEFRLMETFMSRPRRVISAETLMDEIWGWDSDTEMNVIWVYVSNLRKKMRELGASAELKAKRGVGYSLEEKHE